MDQRPYQQKPGLVSRILLGIAALGVVIIGFFFLTIALVAGALLALVVGVRLWWTLRKLKREMGGAAPHSPGPVEPGKDALDGEYQVVERESNAPKLPPQG